MLSVQTYLILLALQVVLVHKIASQFHLFLAKLSRRLRVARCWVHFVEWPVLFSELRTVLLDERFTLFFVLGLRLCPSPLFQFGESEPVVRGVVKLQVFLLLLLCD